jgi:hypothetical protein
MIEPQNTQDGSELPIRGRDRAADHAPLADREVPIPGAELGGTPAAVHAWLDGEGSEADARLADARQVALWSRIADETATRRRTLVPAHVQANIMNALPAAAPARAVSAQAAPVTAASGMIALSPTSALLAAAGLIALGFLAARLVG